MTAPTYGPANHWKGRPSGPTESDRPSLETAADSLETIADTNPYTGAGLTVGTLSIALNNTHWIADIQGWTIAVFACKSGTIASSPYRLQLRARPNPAWYWYPQAWMDYTADIELLVPDIATLDVRAPAVAAIGSRLCIVFTEGATDSGGNFVPSGLRYLELETYNYILWMDFSVERWSSVGVTVGVRPEFPSLAMAPDGTPVVAFSAGALTGSRSVVGVAWATSASTWTDVLLFEDEVADATLPSVAAGDVEAVVVWNVKQNTASTSADRSVWGARLPAATTGSGFSATGVISGAVAGPDAWGARQPPCWDPSVVWAGGSDFAAFFQRQDRSSLIVIADASSPTGGATWSAGPTTARLDDESADYNYFAASAAGGGAIGVAWEGRDNDLARSTLARVGAALGTGTAVTSSDNVTNPVPASTAFPFAVFPCPCVLSDGWWSIGWVYDNGATAELKWRLFDA